MDFFERQERAHRSTRWLVAYFVLAIVFMTVAIYAVFAAMFLRHQYEIYSVPGLWNPELFAYVSLATIGIVFVGSATKIVALRQGGSAVAALLGGVPLDPNSRDLDEKKLLHVVEEMALASGTPVPQIYILPEEPGINAFAAGHSPSDATITVTQGALKLLNRDELQGVIGHEFSHILNGDMRLNLRLMGLVAGILCIAILGRVILQTTAGRGGYRSSRGDRERGGNPLPLIGLALMAIGFIGVFFGRLIKSAVSRQRELLADASSVQFTRNPDGLVGALKKIGGCTYGSRLEAAHAEEASHFYFSNGMADSWFGLMATHPPLEQRIRLLDPAWDGKFPRVALPPPEEGEAEAAVPPVIPTRPMAEIRPPELGDLLGGKVQAAGAALSGAAVRPERIVQLVGTSTPGHLTYAAEFRAALPAILADAAHEPMSAVALIYALLLSPQMPVRTAQLEQLRAQIDPALYEETERLLPALDGLEVRFKLPLVRISLPALTRQSPAQYAQFTHNLQALIDCDQEINLFEYTLEKIVLRHLAPHYGPAQKPVVQFYALQPLLPDCAVLLSALARAGQGEPAQVEQAFRTGAGQLKGTDGELQLLDFADCGIAQIDTALARLALAAPPIKKTVLEACAYTVAADGVIQTEEAELLRAIADTLDCPVPPFVEGV